VNDAQNLRVTGQIYGTPIDQDSVITSKFVHLEHTDGANFYHVNYVRQNILLRTKKTTASWHLCWVKLGPVLWCRAVKYSCLVKANNKYHVAGYIISAEAGTRIYPLKNFFLEANVKAGFANYMNALQ